MESRSEINKAWGEGFSAGKFGKPRSSNPFIGKSSVLARSWDEGWKEGAGEEQNNSA